MTITIDIGNSYTKIAIFENNTIAFIHIIIGVENIWEILNKYPKAKVIWCSVKAIPDSITQEIVENKNRYEHIIFDSNTLIPLKNNYKTPATLGLDRLAAAIGAATLYPKNDVLIIDAGTCITYDLVLAEQGYMGGSISPGFQLRYKSLHDYTAKLPLLNSVTTTHLVGANTQEAIHSGVVNGVIAEVKHLIGQYQTTYPQLKTMICGGDAEFIAQQLDVENIYIEKNLVHLGLNAVLTHLAV